MLNSKVISLHALPNELELWIVVMVFKTLQIFCLMLISRTQKQTVIGLVSNGKPVVYFIWLGCACTLSSFTLLFCTTKYKQKEGPLLREVVLAL